MGLADTNFSNNVVEITKKHSLALAERLMEVCALYNLSKNLCFTLNIEDIFKEAEGLIEESIGVDDFSIMLLDSKREKLLIWKANGATMNDAHDVSFGLGEGVCGVVAKTGQPVLASDVKKDNRFTYYKGKKPNIGSFYSTPLKSSTGEVVGVFNVHKPEPNAMSKNDLVVFNATAEHIAKALENSKIYHEMRRLAISDELTGVHSRRYFLDVLEKELSKAKRRQSPLSLVMFDLDRFKEVNDRYGHITGDKILKRFGGILQANTRRGDIAARYGGEEFVLLLPDVGLEAAGSIAEKIREMVESDTSIVLDDNKYVSFTVSGGVAGYSESGADGKEILSLADKRLFEAKRAGRNKVFPYKKKNNDIAVDEKRLSHRHRVGLVVDARHTNVKSLDIEIDDKWVLCAVDDISYTGFKGIVDAELSLGELCWCRAIIEFENNSELVFIKIKLVRKTSNENGRYNIGVEIAENMPGWKEIIDLITRQ